MRGATKVFLEAVGSNSPMHTKPMLRRFCYYAAVVVLLMMTQTRKKNKLYYYTCYNNNIKRWFFFFETFIIEVCKTQNVHQQLAMHETCTKTKNKIKHNIQSSRSW